jgi:hypothetical protein
MLIAPASPSPRWFAEKCLESAAALSLARSSGIRQSFARRKPRDRKMLSARVI